MLTEFAFLGRFVVAVRLPRFCLLMCVISALHVVIKERNVVSSFA